MKKLSIVVSLILIFLLVGAVFASEGYPWRSHAEPYAFFFENHFDTHQQTQLNGKDQLGGFFYIRYTGVENEEYGVPEAEHGNCEQHDDCRVGWKLKGVAVQATLVDKPEMAHPQWCIAPEDMPHSPGYSHFHWLGAPEHAGALEIGQTYDGYLLKLTAQDHFFFKHHGGFLVTPGIDIETHANVTVGCAD